MSKGTPKLKIRVDDARKAWWMAEAYSRGKSLAGWIRELVDEASGYEGPEPSKSRVSPPHSAEEDGPLADDEVVTEEGEVVKMVGFENRRMGVMENVPSPLSPLPEGREYCGPCKRHARFTSNWKWDPECEGCKKV